MDIKGRILAIDYGTKRTGIAVSDPLQIIANGLDTIPTAKLIDFLKDYIAVEPVVCIVVGEPSHLDGTATSITPMIEKLIKDLKKLFPTIELTTFDERFSSVRASAAILQSGISKKKRRNKALIDKVSATIILQDFMENRRI